MDQDARLPSFSFRISDRDDELVKCRDLIKSLSPNYKQLLDFAEKNWPASCRPPNPKIIYSYFALWKKWQSPIGCDDREWITWGSKLAPHQLKLSRFVEEDVLTKLVRQVSQRERRNDHSVHRYFQGFQSFREQHDYQQFHDRTVE